MSKDGPGRRRRLAIAGVAALVVVAVGAAAGRAWLTRAPRAVTTDEAVESFRASQSTTTAVDPSVETASVPITTSPGPAPSPPGRPPEGVYRYGTDGYEAIDGPIDDRHDYPDETTLTLRHSACGMSWEWRPLVSRADTMELCWSDQGLTETRSVGEHEFFRVRETSSFTCEPPTRWLPPDPQVGSTWTARCTDGATLAERTLEIVGREPVDVGGRSVPSVQVRATDALSGAADGTTVLELWLRPSDGLPLRIEQHVEVRNDSPVGDVTYREAVVLVLLDLEPTT